MNKHTLKIFLICLLLFLVAAAQPVLGSDWYTFQHDNYHTGITLEPAPRWVESYDFATYVNSAPGSGIDTTPVVVGDTVYVIASRGNVSALDRVTGEIKWQTQLGGDFILSTPTVANDKVFVGTNGAKVAALDAATGEVLWLQSTVGQVNTPVIYENGMIYSGSWAGTSGGVYKCFNEQGTQIWSFSSDGGFYWAGAAIVGDYITFGDEDGYLYSLNKFTGALVDTVNCSEIYGVSVSNIRSSLCYVPSTERFYFTSNGGYCCYIGFDPETGNFVEDENAKSLIGGQPTSTPTVYNGRVYVGGGQFLYCLDAETLEQIWTFSAGGRVQSSVAISKYYDDGDGEVYLYFTTNVKNGGLICLRDLSGSTAPTVQFTFSPEESMAQFTLQGVAISDGMVYYGNDAGYLFGFREMDVPLGAGFNYTSDGTSVTITGYSGAGGDVTIPGEIEGLPVTAIGNSAFRGAALTSVTIPDSVTSIGNQAFQYCTALTSVSMGNSVTTIGTYAFQGCTALTSVTLPDSVTSIGANAFNGCSALTSITIGSGVPYIIRSVMTGCTSLTEINVSPDNSALSSIDGIVYSKDGNTLVLCPVGRAGSLVIPNGVTSIGLSAFDGCTSLTSVALPDSVTSIGVNAFNGCSALTSITIGSGITAIGTTVFSGCTALTEINVSPDNSALSSIDGIVYSKDGTTLVKCPLGRAGSLVILSGVTSIGDDAFYGCSSLTSVTIPDGVTSIGNSAFNGCTALTSVTIPNSVTSIGSRAFNGCTSLTSVNIGSGITSIGRYAFQGCTSLSSVTIPDSVLAISQQAFRGCTALTSVTIGRGVQSIDTQVFYQCTSLTAIDVDAGNSVFTSVDGVVYSENGTTLMMYPVGKAGPFVIPSGVTSIMANAFQGCSVLTNVTIPDGVTSIGNLAFSGCSGLTTVVIPGTVTSIGNEAFNGCSALSSVTFSDGVTIIGEKAFVGCKLTSVVIPDSVTTISSYAFSNLKGLTSVTLGNGVTTIDTAAFGGCSALTSIEIPANVINLGQSVFYGCSGLTTALFMGNAPTVGSDWATGCTNLVVYYHEGATGFTTPTWNGVACYPLAVAPVADFEADVTSGIGPLIVKFTDLSTGAPDTWEWDFDNDGTVDSTEQNPSYIYESAGNYTVNLTVSNAGGSDSEVKTDYITVSSTPVEPEPVAAFTADVTGGTAPLTVNFTDQSTGSPTAWAWDFENDGNVDSSEQNPSYTYNEAGNYTVNLTVENAAGTDFELKSDYIEVSEASGSTVTLYFDPESSSVSENESTEISVIASNFPAGFSGYNLTIAIDDPTVAEIVDIEYPSWGLITENSTLPGTSIYLKTVDGNDTVKAGVANVVLATLTVSGKESGSANISIGVDRLDDDSGNVIEPALLTGKIEVTLLSPLPDQEYAPKDLDGDGLYEDLTGNGEFSFVDIVAYFHNMDWIEENMPVEYFDFNGNGRIDFDDVVDMFAMI